MTPQEMLAEGIKNNDMEMIKQASALMQSPVIVKKPRGRPKAVKPKVTKKPKKVKKTSKESVKKGFNVEGWRRRGD